MAKYIKKAIPVEASVYAPGMEDGYVCSSLDGKFIGYYDKNEARPRVVQKPALKTLEGFHEITEGDYIVTGIEGERWPVKAHIFEKTYDLFEG